TGQNIANIFEEQECYLRLSKERVFLVTIDLIKAANNFPRKQIFSLGTCIGRFTHSRKFHLKITSLKVLAPFAKNKVWLKRGAEQHFVYGKNVLKSSVMKLSESIGLNDGVIVFSSSEEPLGFGISAKSSDHCRTAAPTDLVVLWQTSDVAGSESSLNNDFFASAPPSMALILFALSKSLKSVTKHSLK
ncbi:MAG: hypothetical protein MHMPM18_003334, partial [Marteilia pararefringens]